MTACPVCRTPSEQPFLERHPVPVHQNLIVRDVGAAQALNRGRLALHACEACGFVFNAAFDPSLLSYGDAYDNTQSHSPAFQSYVQDLADHVVNDRGVRGQRIVEIGCGKGSFLRALIQADEGNRGVGFDPSYIGPDSEYGGRIRFERRFYDSTCADTEADAIVCRHVIEHVPDPVALLRTVRATLGPSAKVFFETPCVEWILSNMVLWDFFYEHCSYFSAGSLAAAFETAGFSVDEVRHVFGGQYLWVESSPKGAWHQSDASRTKWRQAPFSAAGTVPGLAREFARGEALQVSSMRRRLEALAADGPLAMWGAAAKGVTLANLCDPDRRLIACIVDLNPNKQGAYLPGTGHRIVGPQDLAALGVRTAVVTNPNYMDENSRLLREASLDVRLVDLMQPGEVDAHRH